MFTDIVGQEINVGSFIVYVTRVGTTMHYKCGKVVGTRENDKGKKLLVIGVEMSRIHNEWSYPRRTSVLSYPERVIVVPYVPDNVRSVLETLERKFSGLERGS